MSNDLVDKVWKDLGKVYTKSQIHKCALPTSKVYGISVEDVYQAIDEIHKIKELEKLKFPLYTLKLPLSNPDLPKEVRDLIFGIIEDDKTYKALLETSKSVHKKQALHKHKHFNQLWTLINKYPNKPWDWDEILANPNTSQDKLKQYILGKIETHGGKKRERTIYVQIRQMLENPNFKDINFAKELYHNYLTSRDWADTSDINPFIFESIDEDPYLLRYGGLLSMNPHLTFDFVISHKNIEWDLDAVSANKGITLKDIENNPDYDWSYEGLSENPNVTLEFIEKHIDENWEWYSLSKNPHLTIEFVDKYVDKNWGWYVISKHKNITIQDVEKRLGDERYRWDMKGLSRNPNITIEFVKDHVEGIGRVKWDWEALSSNPGITMQDIESNPTLPWKWYIVFSTNPNFTVQYADKYNNYGMFYEQFSHNPNLTADYVSKHIDKKWNWAAISENKFEPV